MDTTQTLPPPDETPSSARFGPIVFAAQIAALLAAVMVTIVAFSWFVKDGNDYADASVLKHKLLAMDAPKKIVLVGGSNISYGIDSDVITEKTGCPVVNMGMNGYFGVRFMLNEVKPYLHAGDIVVITWEYDSFVKSVEGDDPDLLMVTKANPATFKFLTSKQMIGVIKSYPYAAQQKAFRLFDEAIQDARDAIDRMFGWSDSDSPAEQVDLLAIESVSSFDPATGDLNGHVGVVWPEEISDSMDLTALPLDEDILPMMAAFVEEMNARGVRVMISWTAVADSYYAKHKDAIEKINTLMEDNPVFLIPRPARGFIFDKKYHFDTVYHLTDEGRAIRSPMVADDIISQFGNDAFCKPAP
jgi:hypothetical protein